MPENEDDILTAIFGQDKKERPAVVHPDLQDRLTVGELRRRMEGLPDDAPVYYHRIEDSYFKPGTGWSEHSVQVLDSLDNGYDEYDQYIRAFSAFRLKEQDALYITAHY